MRAIVFTLAAAETAAFAIFEGVVLNQRDPLGRSIGQALALIALVPFGLLVLPALVLAARNRALPAALVLVLLAIPIALFALHVLT